MHSSKTVPNLPPLDTLRRYSIDVTSDYLGQCRSKTYLDISAGKLEIVRDGRRVYVTGRSIAKRSRPDNGS